MKERDEDNFCSMYQYVYSMVEPRGVTPKGLANPQSFKEVSTHQTVCRSLAIHKGKSPQEITELIGGCPVKNRNAMGALR